MQVVFLFFFFLILFTFIECLLCVMEWAGHKEYQDRENILKQMYKLREENKAYTNNVRAYEEE